MKSLIVLLGLSVSTLFPNFSNNENLHESETLKVEGGAYLVFAKKYGGEVSPKDIAKTNVLSVEGCAKGSKIFTYKLKVVKSGKTHRYHSKSNKITNDAFETLKSLEKGDSFKFSSVKAKLPNGDSEVDVFCKEFRVI